ncbi:MAG TPA: sigma factor-like helix-turn-helix DNA-binding protein, partial [Thermoanaerobaculia bacterium]|nr:sigma factor-like helix-turn-helix DNA-binding protein [Thermoanaerobaculia bacterium]
AARTALLRGAVASLPSTERSAFLLTRAASLTVPAAAAALETSEHDVKKSLVRAMDHLFSACQPLLAAPPAASAVPEGTAP